MTQKYVHLVNGFSKTDAQKPLNGFSKTDSPQGRGPPNRRGRIGFSVCTPRVAKEPQKTFGFFVTQKVNRKSNNANIAWQY